MKIAVIGAATVDITAKPDGKFLPCDSNPGKITFSVGGVGMNIASNLARLGGDVTFLTALGGDLYAGEISEHCRGAGIDLSRALFFPDMKSSVYLCVNNEHGDLVAGVSDMELCSKISHEYVSGNIDFLRSCDAVVFDTNLTEDTIAYLMRECTSPLFADCISGTKAKKLARVLDEGKGNLFTLKANRYEAEALTGLEIKTAADAAECAKLLHARGVSRVFITLGADGVFASDGQVSVISPSPCTEIVNSSGAGDALLASLVFSHSLALPLSTSVSIGQIAAKLTLESENTVSDEMSRENLLKLSGSNADL